MINLFDKETDTLLGQVTEGQLQFMRDQMEEESMDDQDYAITPMLLAFFEGEGADADLLALLKLALGDKEEASVYWVQD